MPQFVDGKMSGYCKELTLSIIWNLQQTKEDYLLADFI